MGNVPTILRKILRWDGVEGEFPSNDRGIKFHNASYIVSNPSYLVHVLGLDWTGHDLTDENRDIYCPCCPRLCHFGHENPSTSFTGDPPESLYVKGVVCQAHCFWNWGFLPHFFARCIPTYLGTLPIKSNGDISRVRRRIQNNVISPADKDGVYCRDCPQPPYWPPAPPPPPPNTLTVPDGWACCRAVFVWKILKFP